MVLLLIGLAVSSAVLRATMTASGLGERAYFGSDTRAEALLAGCALGLALAHRPSFAVPGWLGPVGLAGVLGVALVPTGSLLWPGAQYSLAAIASCALLAALDRSSGGITGLGSRPLVWLGTRSYSLYLWHVPVILLLGPMLPADGWFRIATLAVVALALAMLSYAYVEGPFRQRPERQPERVRGRPVPGRMRPTTAGPFAVAVPVHRGV